MTVESEHDQMPAGNTLRPRLEEAVRRQLCDATLLRSFSEMLDGPSRPIVVDANRLRGEIRALAQHGTHTALVTLTEAGFLRVFAARHVLDEVAGYLEKWAHETRTPALAYRDAWVSTLRPLITEASFSPDLLTPDEVARIEHLNQPAPLGDPDDVPTAIAAMVLGAPPLSGDLKALAAVYGADVDMDRHDAYLDALLGGGRVLVVSQWGQGALMLTHLFGGLGAAGLRSLVAKTGLMPLLLGAAILVTWGVSSERTRTWLVQSKDPLIALGNAILDVCVFYKEAEADYSRLASPPLYDVGALAPRVAALREAARRSALDRRIV